MSVQRDTVLVLVLALLALLGLGVAAATLTDTTAPDAAGGGLSGGGGGIFGSSAQSNGTGAGAMGRLSAPAVCLTWLRTPWAVGAVLAVFLALGALAYYDTRSLMAPIALCVSLGIPTALLWYLLTTCGSWQMNLRRAGGAGNRSVVPVGAGSSGGLGEGAGEAASTPSLVLGLLVVVAIAAAVVLLFVSTDDAVESEADEEPEEPAADVGAVGRAAGRAADRIEGEADVDNEVFRAWAEMTDHLAVDRPESSTPSEFADAAVAAGMAEDDVEELTELFEAVRYGGAEVTAEREARALSALRRIESAYAETEEVDDR